MASISTLVDRVKIYVNSSGTGAFQLGAAVPAYRGVEALVNGNTYSYATESDSLYEAGTGVYDSGLGVLVRTPIISSSSGASVAFPAGVELSFTALAQDLIATGATLPIVQATGQSTTSIMSQKAVTDNLNALDVALDSKYDASNPAGFVDAAGALAAAKPSLDSKVARAATRSVLKGFPAIAGAVAYLYEAGREGLFVCSSGTAPSDPLEGLYVTSNTSGFYWTRQWDGTHGRPEWFGAQVNTISADTRSAIYACMTLCPTVQFSNVDYIAPGMFLFDRPYSRFKGVAGDGKNTGHGTRIVLTGSAVTNTAVARFGPANDSDARVFGIEAEDIAFTRNVGVGLPVVASSGLPQDSVTGVVYRKLADCTFNNIASLESPVGHSARLVHSSYFNDWFAFRSTRSQGTVSGGFVANDVFVGFDAGGDAPSDGVIGANASIYLRRGKCFSTPDMGYAYSVGARGWGYFADLFIEGIESAPGSVSFGVELDGRNSSGTLIIDPYAHQDVSIDKVVADGCPSAGLYIHDTNNGGTINVSNVYCGPSGSGAGINLGNSLASLTIDGVRISGARPAAAGIDGLRIVNSQNFTITDCLVRDCGRPGVIANCFRFDVSITANRTTIGTGFMFEMYGGHRGRLTVIGNGVAGAFNGGVSVDNTTSLVEFNGSAIDPGAFNSVTPANKVIYDGADARSSSAFTANGNVLSGVTG